MSIRVLAAAAVLAGAMVGGLPALAADLPYNDRYGQGSPYDDKRYSDIYRHPPPDTGPKADVYRDYEATPRPRAYGYAPYGSRDAEPPYGSYKDDHAAPAPRDYSYEPVEPRRERDWAFVPPRFGGAPGAIRDGCVPRPAIVARLLRRGWHDFHDLHARDAYAFVRARRPNGRVFELTVDRCTGQIVDRVAVGYNGQAYAWRDRRPRWRGY